MPFGSYGSYTANGNRALQLHISAFTLFETFTTNQQAPRDLVTQLQAWVGEPLPRLTRIGTAIIRTSVMPS